MISLILIVLASICDALRDTITHHFGRSVFQALNPKFWNAEISWKNKYVDYDNGDLRPVKWFWNINKPVQLTDAWHLFKMIQIILIMAAIVVYQPFDVWYDNVGMFVLLGLAWNTTFSLFYSHLYLT